MSDTKEAGLKGDEDGALKEKAPGSEDTSTPSEEPTLNSRIEDPIPETPPETP
ncbi:MAG: hypothetical protein R3B09_04225 [Nannocystaceae bacterium]